MSIPYTGLNAIELIRGCCGALRPTSITWSTFPTGWWIHGSAPQNWPAVRTGGLGKIGVAGRRTEIGGNPEEEERLAV